MPDFSVAVNIKAKLGQGFNSTFRRASRLAESTGRRIGAAGRSAGRGLGTLSGAMARAAASRTLQVGAVGAVAAMTKAVHTAVRLEDSMLDLKKTAGALGDVKFKSFTRMLEGYAVSGKTKASVEDLYAASSSLAQVGIARGGGDFLLDWTKLADRAAIAFDVRAESAAEGLSKTVAALGADKSLPEQYAMASVLADAYNHLSNNMGSTAPQLLQFNQRVAGAAKGLGLSGAQSAAWGSALISMGTRVEAAGTAFNAMTVRLLNLDNESKKVREGMQQLGFSGNKLKRMFARDAQGALLQVMKALSRLDKQTRTSLANQIFGVEHGDEISKFTGSIQKYEEALALVRNETVYLGSATQEANARLSGMGAKLRKTRNQLTLTAKEAGTALFPIIERSLSVITPALQGISRAIEKTPALGEALGVTAALGGLGALALGVKKLFVGFGGAKMAAVFGKGAAVTAATLATPVGATLVLTAAIVGLTTLLARKGYNALGGDDVTPAEKDKIEKEEAEKPTGILRGSPRSDSRFRLKALVATGIYDRLEEVKERLLGFPDPARRFAESVEQAKVALEDLTGADVREALEARGTLDTVFALNAIKAEKAAEKWRGFPGTVEVATNEGIAIFRRKMGTLFDPAKETPMLSITGAIDKASPLGSFDEAIEKMRTAGIDPVPVAGSQAEQAASLVGSTAFGASRPPLLYERRPDRHTEAPANLSPSARERKKRGGAQTLHVGGAFMREYLEDVESGDIKDPIRGWTTYEYILKPAAGPAATRAPGDAPAAVEPVRPTDLSRVLEQILNAEPRAPHDGAPVGQTPQGPPPVAQAAPAAGPADVSDLAVLAAMQENNRLLAVLAQGLRERQHRKPFFDTGGIAPA